MPLERSVSGKRGWSGVDEGASVSCGGFSGSCILLARIAIVRMRGDEYSKINGLALSINKDSYHSIPEPIIPIMHSNACQRCIRVVI